MKIKWKKTKHNNNEEIRIWTIDDSTKAKKQSWAIIRKFQQKMNETAKWMMKKQKKNPTNLSRIILNGVSNIIYDVCGPKALLFIEKISMHIPLASSKTMNDVWRLMRKNNKIVFRRHEQNRILWKRRREKWRNELDSEYCKWRMSRERKRRFSLHFFFSSKKFLVLAK